MSKTVNSVANSVDSKEVEDMTFEEKINMVKNMELPLRAYKALNQVQTEAELERFCIKFGVAIKSEEQEAYERVLVLLRTQQALAIEYGRSTDESDIFYGLTQQEEIDPSSYEFKIEQINKELADLLPVCKDYARFIGDANVYQLASSL